MRKSGFCISTKLDALCASRDIVSMVHIRKLGRLLSHPARFCFEQLVLVIPEQGKIREVHRHRGVRGGRALVLTTT
jgi:hypothetical protein